MIRLGKFCLAPIEAILIFAKMLFVSPEIATAQLALIDVLTKSGYWLLGGLVLGYFLPPFKPLQFIVNPLGGLVFGRNETMAGNLSQGVESAPDDEPHLSVMGRYHLRHFSKVLRKQYGFREVKVPRLDY